MTDNDEIDCGYYVWAKSDPDKVWRVFAKFTAEDGETYLELSSSDSGRGVEWLCCKMSECELLETDLLKLRARLRELEQWKAKQLAVESEWDVQAVGKALDIPLGASIRAEILPAIERMQDRIADLCEGVDDLRDALNHANGVIQKLSEGEA